MQLDTARFGVLEVDEKDIVEFPAGIPGFPDMRKYVLIENSEDHIFHIMQSVEDPALAFILVDPVLFVADYKVKVDKEEVAELQLEEDDDTVVLAIVTVPRDNPNGMTANLQAPIVLNPRTRVGRQVVLNDSPYGIRHPLLAGAGGEDAGAEGAESATSENDRAANDGAA